MNQRIRQLAEQATTYIEPTSSSGEGWIFDKEKFAELIVQKCAEIADTERPNSVGCGYITKTKGQLIREHFGVEE